MPAKALWLLQIPEIVSLLETFDVPVVDRAIIERLFGLRRRRAIELLHRFGGFQAGRTFLVDRRLLIEHLRRLAEGEEFQREHRQGTSGRHRRSTAPAADGGACEDLRAARRSQPETGRPVAGGGPGSGPPAHRVFRHGRPAGQTL